MVDTAAVGIVTIVGAPVAIIGIYQLYEIFRSKYDAQVKIAKMQRDSEEQKTLQNLLDKYGKTMNAKEFADYATRFGLATTLGEEESR
jgi:hypothetical protein